MGNNDIYNLHNAPIAIVGHNGQLNRYASVVMARDVHCVNPIEVKIDKIIRLGHTLSTTMNSI